MHNRSINFLPTLLLFSMLALLSCARMRYAPPAHDPIIRVGILEGQEKIHFEPQGTFRVQAATEKENLQLNDPGLWTVSVTETKPGQKHYIILLYESTSKPRSEEFAARMKGRGLRVEVKPFGEVLRVGELVLVDRRNYRVMLQQTFDTQTSADLYFKTSKDLTNARVIEAWDAPAGGTIKLLSPSGKSYSVHDRLRLLGTRISLKNVEVGSGYHWAHLESRNYAGELEIAVNDAATLNLVNVVTLEAYLRGVVAGEMAADFPAEALRAQAIVSRTLFLNNFYRFHRGADFDVCDDVHCQVYVGLTKQNEPASSAVSATHGQVLSYGDRLCTATYSAVCGGHTEDAADVWEGDSQPYLHGDFDAVESGLGRMAFDLTKESNVRLWVTSEPKVYCNLALAGKPSYAKYAEKYFRWQTTARREDLQKWIMEKTGTDVGDLMDILPVRRGVSGRLAEIRLIGSQDTVVVTRELNIRRTLSATALYSACFVVDKINEQDGLAESFRFIGAGWGHGVGMCQIGASVRALRGQNAAQILNAYYPGTRVKKLY